MTQPNTHTHVEVERCDEATIAKILWVVWWCTHESIDTHLSGLVNLVLYLQENNILTCLQMGSREGFSAMDHIVDIAKDSREGLLHTTCNVIQCPFNLNSVSYILCYIIVRYSSLYFGIKVTNDCKL